MEAISKSMYEIELSIKSKLIAVGATTCDKAVSAKDAKLDIQEQNWLCYIAGGMFAHVKKASGNLYYIGAN